MRKEFQLQVKNHFGRYGLNKDILGNLTQLIEGKVTDETTEEELEEICKSYDDLASSFQSDVDNRVQSAVKKVKSKFEKPDEPQEPQDPEPKKGSNDENNALLKAITAISERLEGIERGQAVKNSNQKAIERLKEIGMSDKEVKSAMFGRKFNSIDEVEEFTNAQSELYEGILKDRKTQDAGDGVSPLESGGNYSKAQAENDIKKFNEKY